jgi:hypothetical protein
MEEERLKINNQTARKVGDIEDPRLVMKEMVMLPGDFVI